MNCFSCSFPKPRRRTGRSAGRWTTVHAWSRFDAAGDGKDLRGRWYGWLCGMDGWRTRGCAGSCLSTAPNYVPIPLLIYLPRRKIVQDPTYGEHHDVTCLWIFYHSSLSHHSSSIVREKVRTDDDDRRQWGAGGRSRRRRRRRPPRPPQRQPSSDVTTDNRHSSNPTSNSCEGHYDTIRYAYAYASTSYASINIDYYYLQRYSASKSESIVHHHDVRVVVVVVFARRGATTHLPSSGPQDG